MSKTLTGEDSYSTTVTAPKDGEIWNESTLIDAVIKKLLDNTAYAKARILEITTPTVLPYQPLVWMPTADWEAYAQKPVAVQVNEDGFMWIPLDDLPDQSLVTHVSILFQGSPGNHSALPANMPNIKMYKMALEDGTMTQLGSTVTDTSVDVTAFETVHELTIAAAFNVFRDQFRYALKVTGEGGANWQDASLVLAVGASSAFYLG